MKFIIGVLVCAGAGVFSPALAAPPTSAAAQETTSTSAPPAAATAAAPAATPTGVAPAATPGKAAPATPAAPPAVDPDEKALLADGYRMQMRNGQKMFCRRDQELGSRLGGKTVCGTAKELTLIERQTRDEVYRAQTQQANGPKQ